MVLFERDSFILAMSKIYCINFKKEDMMETKELDMLIIHMGMELKLRKTLRHFLVVQLQDLEPNVSRKH
jgi:hypothetical protein